MSDEQLDKGETGDAIWDAAQYQLALTGHSCMSCSVLTCNCMFQTPPPPHPHPPPSSAVMTTGLLTAMPGEACVDAGALPSSLTC